MSTAWLIMGYIDDLKAARDRYAAELAARQGTPDVRWDEYERLLVEQIDTLNRMIAEAQAESIDGLETDWHIRQAAT
ncbi:MAG: hypothetical protein H5U08_00675 [Thermogutta sp.]|uniref:hypothetical protein n=1 Tax=Thermogutta sp. TaxID=1962930 RepID=UPI0019AF0833|nr:hypothetical protein [Thermogutta sp.]MBC7350849.1 hypothetical protein [Thermogutta sp.]